MTVIESVFKHINDRFEKISNDNTALADRVSGLEKTIADGNLAKTQDVDTKIESAFAQFLSGLQAPTVVTTPIETKPVEIPTPTAGVQVI